MLFLFICFGIRYENYEFCVCVMLSCLNRTLKVVSKSLDYGKGHWHFGVSMQFCLCRPLCLHLFSVNPLWSVWQLPVDFYACPQQRQRPLVLQTEIFPPTFLRNSLKIIFLVGFLSVGESWGIKPANYSLVKRSRVNKNFQYLKKNFCP